MVSFTNGDNDTYPLWYVQETEGFRTTIWVTNLSFLQTEWYVDQLLRQAYESTPLPIEWARPEYSGEAGSAAFVITRKEIEEALRQGNVPPLSYGYLFRRERLQGYNRPRKIMVQLRTGQYKPLNPFTTGEAK